MTGMSESDYRHILNELESLLQETAETIEGFLDTGMDQALPDDYQKLLDIQAVALREQAFYLNALRQEPAQRH
ncbi:MAG: hypothetical protein VBE63_13430 [Lamprobacter sp.]|uniref:hypothetical protein n=1 Tax=Lamprobacter sp. TaxID=3100796 RepID=UPI002B257042|nr:hypothetical protein [Lamprobacter sp.]MEA3640931.1 hypothetical protein [Lamprobacter sp.]